MPSQRAPKPPGIEKGDHVYVQHKLRGPIAVRVLRHGRDGLTGKCDLGQVHQIPWAGFLGHKSRMLHNYALVEQGADGAVVEDAAGRRRYLSGTVPVAKPPSPAARAERKDDPLTGGMDRLSKADRGKRSLYVSRGVKNAADIAAWYRERGHDRLVDPSDMHVTLAYSKAPVDWGSVPDSFDEVRIPASDKRKVGTLGAGVPVLHLESGDLERRHAELRQAGCSHDYDSYKPHLTLSDVGGMPADAPAYPGEIVLGPERFKEVKADWKPTMTKAIDGAILLLKATPVKGRPGLSLKRVTDKAGHQTQRWTKTVPDQPATPAAGGDEKPPAPGTIHPAVGEHTEREAEHAAAKPPMQHGDHVSFRHQNVRGTGQIVGSGKDGVTVRDQAGREHQVRHEHLEGPAAPGGAGGGGDGGTTPPDKFDAASYAAQHIDSSVTPEQILAGFPPDTKQKIDEANAKLAKTPQTIETFKKGGQWTPERQALHAKIVDHFLSDEAIAAATPADGQQPTFTILGGRGGSGKSWFKGKVYDPAKAIVLDADEIKGMLPEYHGWNAAAVHEESGELFDRITAAARNLGLNIVHDATMKTASKALALVKGFKDDGYRTEAHYMFLPPQEAAKRAVSRFLGKTQRFVPPGVVLGNTTNEGSFDQVKGLVDSWSFRDNNVSQGEEPRLISETGNETDTGKSGLHGLPASAGGQQHQGQPAPASASGQEAGGAGGGDDERLSKAAHGGGVAAPPLILILKAQIRGGASGDLFDRTVTVKPHVRDGKLVDAYQSTRHVRPEPAASAPPPPAPSPAPVPDKIRRLAALSGRPTKYEAVLHHADGRKHLVAYVAGRSGDRLRAAVVKRAEHIGRVTGAGPDVMLARDGKDRVTVHSADGKTDHGHIAWSGRTQRDAISEGEHEYVGTAPAPAKAAAAETAAPAAIPASVKVRVKRAVDLLREVHTAIASGRGGDKAYGGIGRYEHETLENRKSDIEWGQRELAKLRDLAAAKGLSAEMEAEIASHGGEPDLEPSEAAKRYASGSRSPWSAAHENALTGIAKQWRDMGDHEEADRVERYRDFPASSYLQDPDAYVHRWQDAADNAKAKLAGHKHHYVSAVDPDTGKRFLVAGPYASREEAMAAKPHVVDHATNKQPDKAPWMAWGTASSADPVNTPLGAGWKPANAAASPEAVS